MTASPASSSAATTGPAPGRSTDRAARPFAVRPGRRAAARDGDAVRGQPRHVRADRQLQDATRCTCRRSSSGSASNAASAGCRAPKSDCGECRRDALWALHQPSRGFRHDHRRPYRKDRARDRRRLGHRARHGRDFRALRRDGGAEPSARRPARRRAGRAAQGRGPPGHRGARAMSRSRARPRTMVAARSTRSGRLDFLVNNAGTPATPAPIPFAELDRLTEDFWQTILNTNLIGPFRCTHAAVGALRAGARARSAAPPRSPACRAAAAASPMRRARPGSST